MNRNARRTKARALELAASIAEKRYRKRLVGVVQDLHRHFLDILAPVFGDVARGWRQDAHTTWKKKLDTLHASIARMREPAGKAYDEMSKEVNRRNFEAAKALLGVTPSSVRTAELIAHKRDENIRLIENAGRAYADDVREIFEDPESYFLSVAELKDRLLERGSVSESRAELIARDQTLKLNAALNETRQVNAGVERYVWSTSKDERVRASHAELDGEEFSWSDPPLIDGEPLNPGEDFQCRCVAIPVI